MGFVFQYLIISNLILLNKVALRQVDYLSGFKDFQYKVCLQIKFHQIFSKNHISLEITFQPVCCFSFVSPHIRIEMR